MGFEPQKSPLLADILGFKPYSENALKIKIFDLVFVALVLNLETKEYIV